MAGNIKLKKALLRAVTIISVIIIIVVGGGTLIMRIYVAPKLGLGSNNIPKGSDVVTFAKYLTDGQVLENLKNFDKQSAKDVLLALLEIDAENQQVEGSEELWNSSITESMRNVPNAVLKYIPKTAKEFTEETGIETTERQQSAYERIMAAATPEEIAAGMAILAKVDIAKVSTLQSQKKNKELKEYIRSVLTSQEISKALSLYKKYKHLL